MLQSNDEISVSLNAREMIGLGNQQRSSDEENVQRSSPRRGVGRLSSPEKAGLRNCVYVLMDTRDYKIRYVGKTSCKLRKRLREHLTDSRRTITKCGKWITSRINNGYDIVMIPVMHDVDTINWEKRMIARLRKRGFSLLNMTDGGDGVPGHKQSSHTKLLKSKAMTGKKKSEKHVLSMSLNNSKPIYLYNANGELMHTCISAKLCAIYLGVDKTTMYRAIERNGYAGHLRPSRSLKEMGVLIRYKKPLGFNPHVKDMIQPVTET